MRARAASFAHAQFAQRQVDIVIDDHQVIHLGLYLETSSVAHWPERFINVFCA